MNEYIEDIRNKQKDDQAKGKPVKSDIDYFTNGKTLFSILSAKYENNGYSRREFREKICNIVIEYLDTAEFEKEFAAALKKLFI